MPDEGTTAVAAPDASAPAATAGTETPWHSTITDAATGHLIPDWHTKAPEGERKTWEAYKDAKSPWDIVSKAHERVKEAQTALRNRKEDGLPAKPVGESATPEALAAYYKARGLPADPKEYGIVKPQDFPQELWNDAEAEGYAKLFQELELTPEQVAGLTKFTQDNARTTWAAHQQALNERKAAEDKARADYIQSQKETMIQNHGPQIDPLLKKIEKLGSVSGLDPARLDPNNPDAFIGADAVKFIESLLAMLPKSGDPTARMLGRNEAGVAKDRAYYQNWKKGDPDYDAWIAGPGHPRFAEVDRQRKLAYEMHAAGQPG